MATQLSKQLTKS